MFFSQLLLALAAFVAVSGAMPAICWSRCRCAYGTMDCNDGAAPAVMPDLSGSGFTMLLLANTGLKELKCGRLPPNLVHLDVRGSALPAEAFCALTKGCSLLAPPTRVLHNYPAGFCQAQEAAVSPTPTPTVSRAHFAAYAAVSVTVGLLGTALGLAGFCWARRRNAQTTQALRRDLEELRWQQLRPLPSPAQPAPSVAPPSPPPPQEEEAETSFTGPEPMVLVELHTRTRAADLLL